MLTIPTLARQRQEDGKFEASLGHLVRSWLKAREGDGESRLLSLGSPARLISCSQLRVTFCRRPFWLLYGYPGYGQGIHRDSVTVAPALDTAESVWPVSCT